MPGDEETTHGAWGEVGVAWRVGFSAYDCFSDHSVSSI